MDPMKSIMDSRILSRTNILTCLYTELAKSYFLLGPYMAEENKDLIQELISIRNWIGKVIDGDSDFELHELWEWLDSLLE